MDTINPIIVSACLIGEPCRYDGNAVPCSELFELARSIPVLPICPECLGGLPVPRIPCEITSSGRVVDASGQDFTDAYCTGAQLAVEIAHEFGCTTAILKSKSPSCGVHQVYDGTFSGLLIQGQGIATAALESAGVEVFDEEDFKAGNVPF